MDVRILGPFDVRSDGRGLELGGPRPISLLAVLVLSVGEVVSTDRLIEELWGESPPRSANHLLHVYVSSLRKALAAASSRPVLLTRVPGYVLELDPDELDSQRFERLLGEGRSSLARADAEHASQTLRDGLALWRGPALADFTYEPFAQPEIARLEELRLVAQEERIEADLALGRHVELVGELEALVAESPLRERPRGQLMLALYRADRQVEALESYRDARRLLVEELGIEPGAALKRLEQAILRHDPALELEARIDTPAVPVHPTRKLVTVLATGLVENGKLDALDPEARRRVIARTLEIVSDVFRNHGGTVERSIGEEVVAVFGVPAAHEDDALRAVRAASDARAAVAAVREEIERDWDVQLDVRSSIETGEVVFEASAVVGDTVPRAVRLNRTAKPGEVLLGESTYRLVRHAVLVDASSPTSQLGYRRLLDVLPDAVPLPRRLDSALVGRESELDYLRATAERAFRDRTPVVVTIVGEAGLGKSRLAEDLVASLDDQATVLVGRCSSYGEGLSFGPLRDVVRQAAGDVSPGAVVALLGENDERETIAAAVTTAIGATEAKVRRDETFVAFRELFAAMARIRSLVLVFEDMHWAEPTYLDLVERVAGTRDAPLVVLCLARPELLEDRPDWLSKSSNAQCIALQPLTDQESTLLIDNLASDAPLPDGVRTGIVVAAEGNPLFLEQMFAMLAGERQSGELGLPPTIRAVLAARLDRLGPAERAVLERASILGREFQLRDLLELLPDEGRALAHRHLHALVRGRLVEPSRAQRNEGDFRFQHGLIHDAVYRAIPKALRAELHERYADWLAQDAGPRLGEVEEILGYHLERASSYLSELAPTDDRRDALAVRACKHLAASGSRALDRGDVAAAIGLLERSFALAPSDGATRPQIMYRLGEACDLGGRGERGSELRVLALDEARAVGDRRLELRLLVAIAEAQRDRSAGQGVAEELTLHVIPELAQLGDDLALARAFAVVGRIDMAAGRHADALAAFERALGHAQRAGDIATLDDVAVWIVNVMGDGPTPVAEALERADTLRAPLGPAGAVALGATTGFLVAMQGRLDEARSVHAQTRAQQEEMGIHTVLVRTLAGETELLAGDPLLAERELAAAWDLVSGGHQAVPWISERRARALREIGRLEEARRFLEIAELHVSPAEGELVARTRATRALIALDSGDLDGAVEDAVEAERLSRPFEAPPLESPRYRGEILLAVAEVLRAAERVDDAVEHAHAALVQFERKGNVVSAERARELIHTLGADSVG